MNTDDPWMTSEILFHRLEFSGRFIRFVQLLENEFNDNFAFVHEYIKYKRNIETDVLDIMIKTGNFVNFICVSGIIIKTEDLKKIASFVVDKAEQELITRAKEDKMKMRIEFV